MHLCQSHFKHDLSLQLLGSVCLLLTTTASILTTGHDTVKNPFISSEAKVGIDFLGLEK